MKAVVYTAIVGNYDNICQPVSIRADFDYVLFSNDFSLDRIGIWEVRKIPYKNDNPTKVARWVKTHPHVLFPGYNYSIWLDANVSIADEDAYALFDKLYANNVLVSSFAHSRKNCAYKECIGVILSGKDCLDNILPELFLMKEDGYPTNNGLCETNCVFMKLDDSITSKVCTTWWKMISEYSIRDQLSFNYCLWKNDINIHYLLGEKKCARNHPFFDYSAHVDNHSISKVKRVFRYSDYIICLPFMKMLVCSKRYSRWEKIGLSCLRKSLKMFI